MPRLFFTSTLAFFREATSVGLAWKSWGPLAGGTNAFTSAQSPATARVNRVIGRKVVWPEQGAPQVLEGVTMLEGSSLLAGLRLDLRELWEA